MRYAPNRIAIHYADIALKGRNRPTFEAQLKRQVEGRLRRLGLDWPVRRTGGRMLIEIGRGAERLDAVLETLGQTPGIATYFAAQHISREEAGTDEQALETGPVGAALLDLARAVHRPRQRFAVRVDRNDPGLKVSTRALERAWGAAVLSETAWEGVNLSHPDRTFHVDLYPEGVMLHGDRLAGLGGMPAGASGRVMAMLSGGIDSPVAAFLMARRGCHVDCLHFSANYLDRDRAAETPVGRLARRLSCYTHSLTLHVAPYVPFDLALAGGHTGYELVLFRRFMLRTAERLARRRKASALVTGDSLSQVASQTLENIIALDAAVEMPIFRPLIGYNKQEIVARARAIGTYETSIEPYKDCCALISRGPKTRARAERLDDLEAERLADYEALIESVLEETVSLRFELGDLVTPES